VIDKKVLIFDRDGTINHKTSDYYVYQRDKFKIYNDAREFISWAHGKGFKIAIATNQRGISKGLFTLENVMELHEDFCKEVNIKSSEIPIFVCQHEIDTCGCRKPKPGLIFSILEYYSVLPSEVLFIGNSRSDFYAAKLAQVDFVQILRDKEDFFLASDGEVISVNFLTDLCEEFGHQ
jgi:D-glycero-D-manno-heptose 1,7-bisphosphate phosphatase